MAASLSVRQQLLGYNSAEAVKLLGLAQGTISPWRTAFASVHPYAIEHEPMELMNERLGSPAPIVEFELPHQGDLLSGVYLEVQLPALAQPDTGVRYYRNGVGLAMIERAELYSQGRLLDRVEKNYLYLNHEFHGTQSEEAVGLCDRVTIPELAQTSATGPTVTVQIPFFFARDQTTFLPINRAREACEQLRVRFVLTPLKDLVVNLHCAPAAPVYSKHVVQCYGRTTWLSERERRHLHEQREYLITTVSALATHGTPILNGVPVRTELPVGGPVKSLLFAIADDNRETVSDVQTALVPFAGNDVRRLVGKFAAVKDVKYDPNGDASTVSDYNSFDPRTERTLTNVLKLQNLADATLAHTAAVRVAAAHGSEYMYTARAGSLSGNNITQWDAKTGILSTSIQTPNEVMDIHALDDLVATAESDGNVRLWDSSLNLVRTFQFANSVNQWTLVFPEKVFLSSTYVFAAGGEGTGLAWMFDLETGARLRVFNNFATATVGFHHRSSIYFSGTHLFTGGVVNPYDAQMFETTQVSGNVAAPGNTMHFNQSSVIEGIVLDDQQLVDRITNQTDGPASSTITGVATATIGTGSGLVLDLTTDANGQVNSILVERSAGVLGGINYTPGDTVRVPYSSIPGSSQDLVFVLEEADVCPVIETPVQTFSGHTGYISSVFVSGDYLFTGSTDSTAKMWEVNTGQLVRTFTGHTDVVETVFVSGNSLFTGSLDNTVKKWSTLSGDLQHTFNLHTSGVQSVSVAEFKSGTALGQYLLTGSLDTTAVRTASSGLGYAPGDSNHPFRASSNILEYRRDGRPGSLMIPGDPFEFRAVDRDTGEEVEPLDRMQLRVDGQDRFSTQATHHHFRSRKFRRAPRRGVYSHSFATDPSGAPSGSLNFSRVNDVEIVVRPNTTNASRLFLYAEKHNLLRTDSRVFSVAHPF